jgi:hypothetical protein
MAVLKIEDAGFDRCYKCKKTKVGGWIGPKYAREFMCTGCIAQFLRRAVKMRERRTSC